MCQIISWHLFFQKLEKLGVIKNIKVWVMDTIDESFYKKMTTECDGLYVNVIYEDDDCLYDYSYNDYYADLVQNKEDRQIGNENNRKERRKTEKKTMKQCLCRGSC